jgi:hypothetical protein
MEDLMPQEWDYLALEIKNIIQAITIYYLL